MAEEWLECQKRIDAYVDEQVGARRRDGREEPAARGRVPRGGVRAGLPAAAAPEGTPSHARGVSCRSGPCWPGCSHRHGHRLLPRLGAAGGGL